MIQGSTPCYIESKIYNSKQKTCPLILSCNIYLTALTTIMKHVENDVKQLKNDVIENQQGNTMFITPDKISASKKLY